MRTKQAVFETAAAKQLEAEAELHRMLDEKLSLWGSFERLSAFVNSMSADVAAFDSCVELAAEIAKLPSTTESIETVTGVIDLAHTLRTGLRDPFEDKRLDTIGLLETLEGLPTFEPPRSPAASDDRERPPAPEDAALRETVMLTSDHGAGSLAVENAAVRKARNAMGAALFDLEQAATTPYQSRAHTIEMLNSVFDLMSAQLALVFADDQLKTRAEELGGLDPRSEEALQWERATMVAEFKRRLRTAITLLESLADTFDDNPELPGPDPQALPQD
jgi:hypothetical protein